MINSTYVANSILRKYIENNIDITPLRLHCLIYLLYSNYLYHEGVLFNESFILDNGIPKLPNLSYKFDCYQNKAIKSYAVNSIEEVLFVKEEDNIFNYCLNDLINKYWNYCDIDLLNYIKSECNLINSYKDSDVINVSDILEDEIKRNEKILVKAKKFKEDIK